MGLLSLLQLKKSFNIQLNEIYSIYRKHIGSDKKLSIISYFVDDRVERPFVFSEMSVNSVKRLNKRSRSISLKFTCVVALDYDIRGANNYVSDLRSITFLDFLFNNFSSKFLVYDDELNVVRRLEIEDTMGNVDADDCIIKFSVDLNILDNLDVEMENTIINEHKVVEDRKVLEKLPFMDNVNIKYIPKEEI